MDSKTIGILIPTRDFVNSGFSYDLELRKEQGSRIQRLIPQIRDIRRNGAAAVDLCYVAMGAVDAYFESSLKEWDFAAGGLIATVACYRDWET